MSNIHSSFLLLIFTLLISLSYATYFSISSYMEDSKNCGAEEWHTTMIFTLGDNGGCAKTFPFQYAPDLLYSYILCTDA